MVGFASRCEEGGVCRSADTNQAAAIRCNARFNASQAADHVVRPDSARNGTGCARGAGPETASAGRKAGDTCRKRAQNASVQKISRTNQENVKALRDGVCSNGTASSGTYLARPPADLRPTVNSPLFSRGAAAGRAGKPPAHCAPKTFLTEIIMSTISRAPCAAQPSWTALLRARFSLWKAAYRTRRIERAAIQQLEQMSDYDLRDIGVARSEIIHAVTHVSARDRAFRRTR
jgi:uncharacterized protein YjiS (DUF1127 family)